MCIRDSIEHFRASTHAREATHDAELGATRDGTLTVLRDDYLIDVGAYNSPFGPPMLTNLMLPGPYRLAQGDVRRRVVLTNKVPGVEIDRLPITAETVWRSIAAGQASGARG